MRILINQGNKEANVFCLALLWVMMLVNVFCILTRALAVCILPQEEGSRCLKQGVIRLILSRMLDFIYRASYTKRDCYVFSQFYFLDMGLYFTFLLFFYMQMLVGGALVHVGMQGINEASLSDPINTHLFQSSLV